MYIVLHQLNRASFIIKFIRIGIRFPQFIIIKDVPFGNKMSRADARLRCPYTFVTVENGRIHAEDV